MQPNLLSRAALGAMLMAGASTPALADAAQSRAAYTRAYAEFQEGDLRSARVELLNALKDNQENAAARLLYARVLLARGDGIAAQTEVERAIRAGAPREITHHLTANSLLLQRQFNRALDEVREARVPRRFASTAARMRGRAQAALRNENGAMREFIAAVRLAPGNADNHVDLARYQASKRQIAASVASVDRALKLAPANTGALMLKGDLTRATQGLEPALPYFTRVLAADPNNIEALLERAATLGDLKREDEARADLAKVKGLAPGHPLALYLEAVLAARKGQFQEAQQLLGQTKGMLDRYPPAQLLQGLTALQLNNLTQASETLSRFVAASPENLAGRRLLGMTQLRRGDARGALVTLKPFEALDARLDPQMLAILGQAYAQTGDFARSQRYLERAKAAVPNSGPLLGTQLAMTRFAQGDVKGAEAGLQEVLKTDPNALQALVSLTSLNLQKRDFRAGLASANRIVVAHPTSPIGYNLRGTARIGLRDAAGAEADFRAALQRQPSYAEARRNLGQLLVLTNRVEEGRKELAAILTQTPNDARTMMLMADVAGIQKNMPERIDWLRRAATAAPNAFQPKAALVQTYIAARQPNRALNEASALARADPKNPRAQQILAGAQIAARQPNAAVQTLEQLAAARPADPGARVALGQAQAVAGSPAQARASFEAALKLPGGNQPAVYMQLIGLDMRAKRYDDALRTAERLKASTPNKLAADKLIGDIHMAANRPRQALVAYSRVRQAQNNAQTTALVANAQLRAGEADAALATTQAFARANPKDALARTSVADIQLQRQDWRGAIATYEAMRRDGVAANDVGILNNLAYAYGRVGDRRALATAAEAHKRAPGSPAVQDTYGHLLVTVGRDAKRGLALLQQASRAAPQDPNIRMNLANAYRANGMRAEARREAEAALRQPGLANPAAARALLGS